MPCHHPVLQLVPGAISLGRECIRPTLMFNTTWSTGRRTQSRSEPWWVRGWGALRGFLGNDLIFQGIYGKFYFLLFIPLSSFPDYINLSSSQIWAMCTRRKSFKGQKIWVYIMALLTTSCVSWGKLLPISGPSSHLCNGSKMSSLSSNILWFRGSLYKSSPELDTGGATHPETRNSIGNRNINSK